MELLNNNEISLDQWLQLFILAMALITVSSIVTMFSVWVLSAKLSDIRNTLQEQSKASSIEKADEINKPPMLDQ